MKVLSALIGSSTVIRHVHHLVVKVAELDTPVLISGEAGTGKEHVAKLIHHKSTRTNQALVTVKCLGTEESKVEDELFGTSRIPGKLEEAGDGAICLEEVSGLSMSCQNLLMMVISEGCISTKNDRVPFKTRIYSTSSVALENLVKERKFREDLYYRLATNALYIPPLRERREDIPHLVEHFINRFNIAKNKNIVGVSPDAMSALLQYAWNHNVDELENLTERIVVLKGSGTIEIADLPPRLRQLVTDNIDTFYERSAVPNHSSKLQSKETTGSGNHVSGHNHRSALGITTSSGNVSRANISMTDHKTSTGSGFANQSRITNPFGSNFGHAPLSSSSATFEDSGEIEQFIKKEIDLGSGIDFYRVVEEFENRLIAEALRRTNHNKNRAAQLLSMNRTTLVEKLKKRASSGSVKIDSGRVKRNPAFTIFDSLGEENEEFENLSFGASKNIPSVGDLD